MADNRRLIDANVLEKFFREKVTHLVYNSGNFCILVDHVLHTVRNAPTVDAVEVVHGRWEKEKSHADFDSMKCTACGGLLLVCWHTDLDYYNYCPNCGAKMDGDGNA